MLQNIDLQPWLQQLDIDLQAVSTVSLELLQWCNAGWLQPIPPGTVLGLMDMLAMAPTTPPEEDGGGGATAPQR